MTLPFKYKDFQVDVYRTVARNAKCRMQSAKCIKSVIARRAPEGPTWQSHLGPALAPQNGTIRNMIPADFN